ncbi:MAG TPA: hypothetical protein VD866_30120 [Urbifossiella sp.]|nr:hypothetical protein [Urbifossiella sp.]
MEEKLKKLAEEINEHVSGATSAFASSEARSYAIHLKRIEDIIHDVATTLDEQILITLQGLKPCSETWMEWSERSWEDLDNPYWEPSRGERTVTADPSAVNKLASLELLRRRATKPGPPPEALGEMTVVGYRLPIYHATFRRITNDRQGRPGWEFNVCTQPPIEVPTDESKRFLFANGVRFCSEGKPIPLHDVDDLTGTELFIEELFNPESCEDYFTLYMGEYQLMSHVRLRFLQRRGSEYRIRVTALVDLVDDVSEDPAELAFECWIIRQQAVISGG